MEQRLDDNCAWIGHALRGWRQEAGLSLEVAAGRVGWSPGKLDGFETARVPAGPVEIAVLAAALGIHDDERDRTLRRLR